MAETRKYSPGSSPVGDAVRAALGEPVRPVNPGERPASGATGATEEKPVTTVRTFTFQRQTRHQAPEDSDGA